jgi:hypothetical protein
MAMLLAASTPLAAKLASAEKHMGTLLGSIIPDQGARRIGQLEDLGIGLVEDIGAVSRRSCHPFAVC